MVMDARFAIGSSACLDPPPAHNPIFRIVAHQGNDNGHYIQDADPEEEPEPAVMFPSMRLLVAALLCCCFIALSVSTSNMAVALICMTSCPIHGYGGELRWKPDEEGYVLAAQNAGSLLMLLTGMFADRLNGKLMVCLSLILVIIGNGMLPLMAPSSFWYAVIARLLVGASDACLMPATNSLITRWFPQAERAAAIGLITGGRQIGTLFILPTAGYLCTRKDILNGWPAIFYLSAAISLLIALFWIPIGADKPGKQCCISQRERLYVESRIACESIGKRSDRSRRVPYRQMIRSTPLLAAVFALVFNGVASAGLSASILIVPLFNKNEAYLAVGSLSLAMIFAGLHTPGVQTSLVQLAPPFSGVITGWSFFVVAWFGIANKILTKHIVQHGSSEEWGIVLRVAGVVAALPVVVFSLYGSAEKQHWAAPSSKSSVYSLSNSSRKTSTVSRKSAITNNN
ncbi:hypothetical protein PRIPAC_81287 [Pristionchus pacificus]|uniref:Cima-1 n=1 Tax=Pristionchus pacificus TaxID=54126 RepID=A0A2A6BDY3_PRIPA|nr:hypothetical protein PRIPAC_81287 [Pristionchus pacificus]|eukprot:PDM64092.1 cima-1 [Pristionchus pacificus]